MKLNYQVKYFVGAKAEFLKEQFGDYEVLEAEVTPTDVKISSETFTLTVQQIIHNNPLVFEGHTFEVLRDFRIEYPELGIYSKTSQTPWSLKKQAESALTYWVAFKVGVTRGSNPRVPNELKEKFNTEKELLKQYKTQKPQESLMPPTNIQAEIEEIEEKVVQSKSKKGKK